MEELYCGVCAESKGLAAACMLCWVYQLFNALGGWE